MEPTEAEAVPPAQPRVHDQAEGGDEADADGEALDMQELSTDPADVTATLGNVASDLATQLSSITEEMNKIREELYGKSGLGGIATELEKLKADGLGGLLK